MGWSAQPHPQPERGQDHVENDEPEQQARTTPPWRKREHGQNKMGRCHPQVVGRQVAKPLECPAKDPVTQSNAGSPRRIVKNHQNRMRASVETKVPGKGTS
jgi:hypothetical protein